MSKGDWLIELRKDRLYYRTQGVEVDVTRVWHFAKDALAQPSGESSDTKTIISHLIDQYENGHLVDMPLSRGQLEEDLQRVVRRAVTQALSSAESTGMQDGTAAKPKPDNEGLGDRDKTEVTGVSDNYGGTYSKPTTKCEDICPRCNGIRGASGNWSPCSDCHGTAPPQRRGKGVV